MLQQQIVKEMQASTDLVRKNILRIIVGEFQRCASKELTDDAVIKLLKFCIKNERILIANTKPGVDTTENLHYIKVLSEYIPADADVSIEVVKEWVESNVDFTKFPTKIAAMKMIMQNFKGKVDGNSVKELLLSM